ncbi:MAG: 50S ribosomal protein L15 [Patescibacteria group bacterium]|nr:50S ribosomal protein L15 [Patescibacteria group bacterium]
MALNLYNLRPAKGAKKNKKRVGRGDSSGHGTYSTRGQKGQRARSGGRRGLKMMGLKTSIQSIPKLGGFKSLKPKNSVINLKDLEVNFKDGENVSALSLWKKGLTDSKYGVKILGEGKISKKLNIADNVKISASAKEAIEKAGGKVASITAEEPKENK